MLSAQDNELICRVGPGTPMGNLFRQYWLPAMLSSESTGPDCDPVRVLLLGEKLIGFRDSAGKIGLIQNHCPHRGASLFFGRNEEGGLRCVYHGWKFDAAGQCVDMPNEPAESNFKSKVQAIAYPCQERGGVVWTYMGPRTTPPPLPQLEGNMMADSHLHVNATFRDCNWLQALEGDIDTTHAGFLHEGARRAEDQPTGSFAEYMLKDRSARFAVLDSEGGCIGGAVRDGEPGHDYWRIAEFLFPCYTMAAPGLLGLRHPAMCKVPMDDEHTLQFFMPASSSPGGPGSYPKQPNTTDWLGRFRPIANAGNDYLLDREVQRRNEGINGYTGIPGVGTQDYAITWSMGPIFDRGRERLGSTDALIIRVRRRLLDAARALQDHRMVPPGVDRPDAYAVRSGGVMLPKGVDWVAATAELRRGFVHHPEVEANAGRCLATQPR